MLLFWDQPFSIFDGIFSQIGEFKTWLGGRDGKGMFKNTPEKRSKQITASLYKVQAKSGLLQPMNLRCWPIYVFVSMVFSRRIFQQLTWTSDFTLFVWKVAMEKKTKQSYQQDRHFERRMFFRHKSAVEMPKLQRQCQATREVHLKLRPHLAPLDTKRSFEEICIYI